MHTQCKSVLIYYEVPGGVLCVNLTAVLNTFLPAFIVPFIDSLGYYGTQEACDTARLTRTFLKDIEDSPEKFQQITGKRCVCMRGATHTRVDLVVSERVSCVSS